MERDDGIESEPHALRCDICVGLPTLQLSAKNILNLQDVLDYLFFPFGKGGLRREQCPERPMHDILPLEVGVQKPPRGVIVANEIRFAAIEQSLSLAVIDRWWVRCRLHESHKYLKLDMYKKRQAHLLHTVVPRQIDQQIEGGLD